MTEPLIELTRITKRFTGVVALDQVSLAIEKGQCHALMGENGAGKSTLGKIIAGIHKPDAGMMKIDGQPVRFGSPRDAAAAGIGMVHQELAFCPDLTVAENLSIGRYPTRLGLIVSRRGMRQRAAELLEQIGPGIDPGRTMRELSTAQEQQVQIAAALGIGARILIFDEPTSSLSQAEAEQLFHLIERLKQQGVTMIYVSHRMPEVLRLCDSVSVLRDGKYVGTLPWKEADEDRIVRMMIGRSVETYFPSHVGASPGKVLLRASDVASPGQLKPTSLEVRAGEIVGLAGLVGAGRSELAQALFGLDSRATGQVEVNGRKIRMRSVGAAMRAGMGFVPEDRKRQGLVLPLSGRENFALGSLKRFSRLGFMNRRAERLAAADAYQRFDIRAPSSETPVMGLSGGNQQKVVLARWLARDLKVLIVDEPTRGVDVGAKAAIHKLLDELAKQGVAIVLISSELPEVVNLSTRVLVRRAGGVVAEVPREQATQDHLMRLMAGVKKGPTVVRRVRDQSGESGETNFDPDESHDLLEEKDQMPKDDGGR